MHGYSRLLPPRKMRKDSKHRSKDEEHVEWIDARRFLDVSKRKVKKISLQHEFGMLEK